jgi:hypothetical protein
VDVDDITADPLPFPPSLGEFLAAGGDPRAMLGDAWEAFVDDDINEVAVATVEQRSGKVEVNRLFAETTATVGSSTAAERDPTMSAPGQ